MSAALKNSFPSHDFEANLSILNTLALGSGILFAYPQLATITGVQGVVVYAVASASPLMIFALLGPIIRKKCPEGFVLTEWTRQRYGIITALYLSFLTLVTMFLYMVAELSALQQIMTALTGMGKSLQISFPGHGLVLAQAIPHSFIRRSFPQ